MQRTRDEHREIGAAERGHLIQRVLVDGWTTAEAAQLIGADERRVRRWVADYRKHGMTSLRSNSAESAPRRWRAWLGNRAGWLMGIKRRAAEPTAPCIVLNSGDQRHHHL